VLKTLAVRTGPGGVLAVIPASHRLDLRLVREAVGDNHARLPTEEDLSRDFEDYKLVCAATSWRFGRDNA
jgi:prolyl-tRNA editing enzyme YbaK/EbsC (Cys-tRNA(Pro) deacylase)